jgi:hypothetical protein
LSATVAALFVAGAAGELVMVPALLEPGADGGGVVKVAGADGTVSIFLPLSESLHDTNTTAIRTILKNLFMIEGLVI